MKRSAKTWRNFFDAFPPREGRFPFEQAERVAFTEQNREAYDSLAAAVKRLEAELAALPSKPDEVLAVARRAFELRGELAFLLESNERNYVYWFERRNKGVFLAATPIDVSQILKEKLFAQFETVVLTSATLAIGDHFDFIKQRLGVEMARTKKLASEYASAARRCCTFRRRCRTCATRISPGARRRKSRACSESARGALTMPPEIIVEEIKKAIGMRSGVLAGRGS